MVNILEIFSRAGRQHDGDNFCWVCCWLWWSGSLFNEHDKREIKRGRPQRSHEHKKADTFLLRTSFTYLGFVITFFKSSLCAWVCSKRFHNLNYNDTEFVTNNATWVRSSSCKEINNWNFILWLIGCQRANQTLLLSLWMSFREFARRWRREGSGGDCVSYS